MKEYFTVEDKSRELNNYRENGNVKGDATGWLKLNELISIKRGYPIFIAGAPHSGKTEWVLELMLSLSVHFGYKWFVYSGEIGSVTELISELCFKMVGKPFIKREHDGHNFQMSQAEKTNAEYFISQHFWFLDTEDPQSSIDSFTVEKFYEIVSNTEKELGTTFSGTLIDPWNDVENEIEEHGGREDLWLQDALKVVRRDSKKNNRVNLIINHIADIKPVIDPDTKRRYIPVALPSEWAGGRTWWRRAFLMILIYRPPTFLFNENGRPYEQNETHIIVQKAKPKGSARIGISSLYWDWKTNRYYEIDDYGTRISPFEKPKTQQTTLTPVKKTDEDPF